MPKHSKLILAAAVAAAALGAIVSTTSANRIALSEQLFRATWSNIRFIGFALIECHLTIEGSFHSRTGSKILENLVGYVTRSIVAETQCTGASARILTEALPWHIRYGGFTGTLPQINTMRIRIIGSKFLVQIAGIAPAKCLYTSTAASPIPDIVSRNTTTGVAGSITVEESAAIPFSSGTNIACGTSARLEGTTNSLTQPGSTTKITVTLVA
jgi:hypothetical protein